MIQTLHAVFDGQVLRPQGPLELKPNVRYVITVEREEDTPAASAEQPYPLTAIRDLASDMGVSDLAARRSPLENVAASTDPTRNNLIANAAPAAAREGFAPDSCDAVIEAYKKDVDRTLLRENLKLTPEERFRKFERFMRSVLELRGTAGRPPRGS